MHAITRSTLPRSRLAVDRGVSYIIELHVVTRARTTADLTRTVPNYRRAVEGERVPHTARPEWNGTIYLLKRHRCRKIRNPRPSRGYSFPPRGRRRGSPFLDRAPARRRRSRDSRTNDVFLKANEFAVCNLISSARLWCPSAVPSGFRLIMHEIRRRVISWESIMRGKFMRRSDPREMRPSSIS